MDEKVTGGCLCGRVRYTATIRDDNAYACHCRMCQRASGALYLAFKTLPRDDVAWEREPDAHASSPIARRGFCATCGTSLTFEYPGHAKLDLTVASFDDPYRFRPTYQFGVESRHDAWRAVADLPGTRSEDYQPLADRWRNAGAEPPA